MAFLGSLYNTMVGPRTSQPDIPAAKNAAAVTPVALPQLNFSEHNGPIEKRIFSFVPEGQLIRCITVSTQWRTLILSLPGKKEHFQTLRAILLKMRNYLSTYWSWVFETYSSDHYGETPWPVPFLKLAGTIDRDQAKKVILLANQNYTIRELGGYPFLSVVYEIDPELEQKLRLDDFDRFCWTLLVGHPRRRAAAVLKEKEYALTTESPDPHRLLGLLETARERLTPEEREQLLQKAVDAMRRVKDEFDRFPYLLRVIEVCLLINSSEEGFRKVKALLELEPEPRLQVKELLRVARKEKEAKSIWFGATLGKVEEVLRAMEKNQRDACDVAQLVRILAEIDLEKAKSLLGLIEPHCADSLVLAKDAVETASMNEVESPSDPLTYAARLTHVVRLIILSRKEAHSDRQSAQKRVREAFERAKLINRPFSSERIERLFHQLSEVALPIDIELSYEAAKWVSRPNERMDAMFPVAKAIAELTTHGD